MIGDLIWAAEGMGNGRPSIRDVRAYVSCRGYVSILLSARSIRESRWHRGRFSSLTRLYLVRDFFMHMQMINVRCEEVEYGL